MTFNEYQERARETAVYPERFAILYPALKLAGEAGEVAEKVGKRLRDHDGNLSDDQFKAEIAKELGDVLWYISALANDLMLPLGAIAVANLSKLESRKERGVLQGSGDNR